MAKAVGGEELVLEGRGLEGHAYEAVVHASGGRLSAVSVGLVDRASAVVPLLRHVVDVGLHLLVVGLGPARGEGGVASEHRLHDSDGDLPLVRNVELANSSVGARSLEVQRKLAVSLGRSILLLEVEG